MPLPPMHIHTHADTCAPSPSPPAGYPLKTREDVRQLFMKIDADAGGTVDWVRGAVGAVSASPS